MGKLSIVIGAVLAILIGLSATALLFSPASSRPSKASYSIIEVCATVTPKSASLTINGQPVTIGPVSLSRTCTGV